MEYITVGGVTFEAPKAGTKVYEKVEQIALTMCNTYYYYTDIHKAYGKPSSKKVNIWERWKQWFDNTFQNDSYKEMWICSRNTDFFSIGFKVRYKDHSGYNGYITPSHNYITMKAGDE